MGQTARGGGSVEGVPPSERVPIDGGWSLQEVGAENREECVWLSTARPDAVTIALACEGRHVMRVLPCAVLAHVLRVQGYDVAMRAEAAE